MNFKVADKWKQVILNFKPSHLNLVNLVQSFEIQYHRHFRFCIWYRYTKVFKLIHERYIPANK